jgi:hypothetical protein
MKLAENIDYSKPVEFRAWHDGKSDSTALFVGQDGTSVPQKYTRENPGDLPQPTQNFKGDWDYSKQEEFLYKRMIEVVIPMVAAAHPETDKGEDGDEAAKAEVSGYEEAEQNGQLDPKLLEQVKVSLTELAKEPKYQDRTKIELIQDFFGVSRFSEIEEMPSEAVRAALKTIDKIIVPF